MDRSDDIDAQTVAEALPGWQVTDGGLARHVTTPSGDAELLAQSLRHAAGESGRELDVRVVDDGVVITLQTPHSLSAGDVDAAAGLEAILSGTGPQPPSTGTTG